MLWRAGLLRRAGGAYETGCGRRCLSTAVLDTDLLLHRGAVLRVEAVARATASRGRPIQAKRRASIPCARGNGRGKQLQVDSTCIEFLDADLASLQLRGVLCWDVLDGGAAD